MSQAIMDLSGDKSNQMVGRETTAAITQKVLKNSCNLKETNVTYVPWSNISLFLYVTK
jgi:hypothetical protein